MSFFRLLILFVTVVLAVSCNNNTTQIKGVIENARDGEFVVLSLLESGKSTPIDSVELSNSGKFKFLVKPKQPAFYTLGLNRSNIIILLCNAGEKVKIKADALKFSNGYLVEGSEGSEKMRELSLKLIDTRSKIDSLRGLYTIRVSQASPDSVLQQLSNRFNEVVKSQRDFSIQFIINNLHSLASIYALYQELEPGEFVLNTNRDLQYIKIVADTLQKYYPQSVDVKALLANKEKLIDDYARMRILSMSNGVAESFPNIQLPDQKNEIKSLNDLKGKNILLQFTSTSVEVSDLVKAELKEVNKRFAGKNLIIYEVSLEEDQDKWAAQSYAPAGWINVIDTAYLDSKNARNYNVTVIPSNFIIDNKGAIVSRNVFGPQLMQLLNEVVD